MDFRLNLFPFFHALRIAMRAQGILLLFFPMPFRQRNERTKQINNSANKKRQLSLSFFVCRKMPRGAAHME